MSVNDKQVGGSHYKTTTGKQHWDILADAYGPGYIVGCCTKYLFRWRDKNGIQDLQKSKHYLEKLIDLYENIHYKAKTGYTASPTHMEDIPRSVGTDELKIALMVLNHPWPGLCGGAFDMYSDPMEVLKTALSRLTAFIESEERKVADTNVHVAQATEKDAALKEVEGGSVKDAFLKAQLEVASHPDYQPRASELHPD